MKLSQLVSDSYLTYRGKLSSVPAAGTEKYNRIVNIANRKQREWAQDSNIDWPSRYERRDAGSLSVNQQVYDIDDDILRLSDFVRLTAPNGNKINVAVIKPQTFSTVYSGVYMFGANPRQLKFIQTIDSSYTGYTMTLPCYTMPPDMTTSTSFVYVDDPQWLVYAVAAELARNDYSKEEQYSNLRGDANDLYTKMLDDAQSNGFLQPNGVTNAMPQSNTLGYNY